MSLILVCYGESIPDLAFIRSHLRDGGVFLTVSTLDMSFTNFTAAAETPSRDSVSELAVSSERKDQARTRLPRLGFGVLAAEEPGPMLEAVVDSG